MSAGEDYANGEVLSCIRCSIQLTRAEDSCAPCHDSDLESKRCW